MKPENRKIKEKPSAAATSPQKNRALNKATKANPSSFFATIYTDGGTRNTGNFKGGHVRATDKAAWAYLIEWQEDGQQKSVYNSNGEFGATNNKMELTALIEALKKLLELNFNHEPLLFVLDSQYVLNPITKGWLKAGPKALRVQLQTLNAGRSWISSWVNFLKLNLNGLKATPIIVVTNLLTIH